MFPFIQQKHAKSDNWMTRGKTVRTLLCCNIISLYARFGKYTREQLTASLHLYS